MGYKVTFVEFKGELPEIEKVVERLREKTNVEIEHSTIGYGSHCFLFKPKKDRTPCVNIECCFYSRQNTIKVEFQSGFNSESLNRYPNYFHFSLVSTLVELGGLPSKELPFYSNFSWNNWVKLNGRPTPSFFKVLAFKALAIFFAVLVVPIVWLFVWLYSISFSCFYWFVDCYNEYTNSKSLIL